MKYYAILDQGTSSCRTIIYDESFNIIDKQSILLTQYFPKNGWVEHDPIEIWNATRSTLQQALVNTNITGNDLLSIGITNQRETIVAWNKKTGLPIYNAIVWQDNRTIDYCDCLNEHKNLIYEKTGLILNPYFSATKIKWILDNVKQARELLKTNNLMVGTIDTWLLYKLTGSKVFATDYTNASRTMLFNIHTKQWDEQLLDIFNIPKQILANVYPSSHLYGYTYSNFLSKSQEANVPITCLAGDQQASLFGHLCINEGQTKITLGTGCFILMNMGKNFIKDNHNQLITTLSCSNDDEHTNYVLEGCVFNCGNIINWLQNNLRIIYEPREIQFYCDISKNNNSNLLFIPTLNGVGAPYWDNNATGTILGLNLNTKREDIVRSCIEGIGYQICDVIKTMNFHNTKKEDIHCDGGLVQCDYLMQFNANLLQNDLLINHNYEISSLGCAYLCAWNLNKDILKTIKPSINIQYKPMINNITANNLYQKWKKAIELSLKWK